MARTGSDTTSLTASTSRGKESSANDRACLRGREKRKGGSNSSERAAAGEAQFTPGGKREREHPRKTALINSTENHGKVTENKGKKGIGLPYKKERRKKRKKGNGQTVTEAPV